ncbi:MAG: hypothetical protein AAF288_03165 [Planctomycetota bacterium]
MNAHLNATPADDQPAPEPLAPEQDLRQQLERAHERLRETEQAFAQLERRQRIDALLAEQGALDLEAGRLLTEAAVNQMDEPDLQLAVADLRKHRPWLFPQRPAVPSALADALAPEPDTTPQDPAHLAAQRAAETGDRRDLLAYLRLKRRA